MDDEPSLYEIAAMEAALDLQYINSSQHAISPDNFRRGWLACLRWGKAEQRKAKKRAPDEPTGGIKNLPTAPVV